MKDAVKAETTLSQDPALLNRIAWGCRWQSRLKSAEYANLVLKMLKGERRAQAGAHRGLANVTLSFQAKWRGAFDDAMHYALKAEHRLDESAFPRERGELYSIMGVVHYSRHRLDLADGVVQRGLKLVSEDADPNTYSELLTTCAAIHRYSGDLRTAGEVLGRARRLATGAGLARVEHNVARWMQSDDAPSHALQHAETSLELAVAHQNNVILPYAHEVAGACLVDLEEFDRAERHFTTGLDLATADDDTRAQCQIIGWFAGLEKKRGALEQARDLYCYGRGIAKRMDYNLWEKTFARRLAEVYEGLGDLKNAIECHNRAWKLEDDKRQ